LFWSIAVGGAAFDLGTKSWIFARVGPPHSPPLKLISNILELRTSHNKGALWGLGSGFAYSSEVFAALSIAATIAIVWFLFVRGGAKDRVLTAALGLITAGALGNCHDRLRFGYVRDFVYFHVDSINFSFAIFNFADNMLVLGAIILMLLALRPEESLPQPSEPSSASASVPS
jgi:signal peptidase II